jgi:hypothetical protein
LAYYNARFKLGHCQFQNRLTQQPIPIRRSTKPPHAVKPSKIRDVPGRNKSHELSPSLYVSVAQALYPMGTNAREGAAQWVW